MAEVLTLFGLCYHGLRRSVGQLSSTSPSRLIPLTSLTAVIIASRTCKMANVKTNAMCIACHLPSLVMSRFRWFSKAFFLAHSQVINPTRCQDDLTPPGAPPNNTMVFIPGGGIAGVVAARTPHEQSINDFVIVEAKSIFGGRMTQMTFGVIVSYIMEKGPN
ncbi:hypothetical protein EDC04DRAFT_2233339 [Pisolithus marmoratus]|nr:hypothetical protein EDC04DRAFT_2233339 [Pisolithus marmoratus]